MTKDATPDRLRSRLRMRQWQTLLAIADAGGLRQAALTLGVSQPALSKALKDLEAAIGRPLFERSARGLTLTPHGEVVTEHARQALHALGALADALAAVDTGAGGRLRVGIIPNLSSDWMRAVAARLIGGSRPLHLQLTEGATDELLLALRGGALDAAMVRITPANAGGDLTWRPMLTQRLKVIVRTGHPLLRMGRRATLRHLLAYPWLLPPAATPTRRRLDEVFLQAGLTPPQTHLETYALPLIERFVVQEGRLAAVPDDVARQFERLGGIRALGFEWDLPPVCLAWLDGRGPQRLIHRFEQAALAVA